ncbi:hypothetical protein SPFL3102_01952 [Sporomusaceae bacterium FL31]|nr:hypothetical protein SPFL3101_03586 [Sporomusaceae bacterium FL31]GCE34143.1 hypothetical protein SPFL3102_01952 [Sporomusaceae bacterium]
MSNQVILWVVLIVPWLSLFFMKMEDIKRFMPVALFSALASVVIVEIGQTSNWFFFEETFFPFRNASYYVMFGLNPVTSMWILLFLYGKFMRYLVIDTLLNIGFIYFVHIYFLGSRGLFHEVSISPLQNALITTAIGLLVYGYQVWQEGMFIPSQKRGLNMNSILAKPLSDDKENSRKK